MSIMVMVMMVPVVGISAVLMAAFAALPGVLCLDSGVYYRIGQVNKKHHNRSKDCQNNDTTTNNGKVPVRNGLRQICTDAGLEKTCSITTVPAIIPEKLPPITVIMGINALGSMCL